MIGFWSGFFLVACFFVMGWMSSWFWSTRGFIPRVGYNKDARLTQLVLQDTLIVWVPWGPYEGHAVDCGYDQDGNLVGIAIWDDVRKRPAYSDMVRGVAGIIRD